MKKILIFGSGKQGKKYIKYFLESDDQISIINKTGIFNDIKVENINSFCDINHRNLLDLNFYDLIIVAVFPYVEQTKVIEYLLLSEFNSNLIIEKPITENKDLLDRLYERKNITFFIDEIYFARLFSKKEVLSINIKVDISSNEELEHALGFFLLNSTFENILNSLKIENKINNSNKLIYEIITNNYCIKCNNGYYINNKKISNGGTFDESLSYILNLLNNISLNDLYKKNMILMYKNIAGIIKE